MAPLLREIVREAIVREPDLDIVAEHDEIDVRSAVELDDPDFIIVGEDVAAQQDVRKARRRASRPARARGAVGRQGERALRAQAAPHPARRGLLGHARPRDPGGAEVGREDVRDDTSERRIG